MSKLFDLGAGKLDLGRLARNYRRLAQQEQEDMVFPEEPARSPTPAVIVQDPGPEAPDAAERALAHRALLKRANTEKPDAATLAELRAFFDAAPDAWHAVGDLAQLAEKEVVTAIAPTALQREAISRVAQEMREALGALTATVMERALIEHVVLCWLRLQRAEINYTRILAEPLPLTTAAYWERRLTAAQTRYLRAVETLARVRRLVRPTPHPVQINVAEAGGQQVNQALFAGE